MSVTVSINTPTELTRIKALFSDMELYYEVKGTREGAVLTVPTVNDAAAVFRFAHDGSFETLEVR